MSRQARIRSAVLLGTMLLLAAGCRGAASDGARPINASGSGGGGNPAERGGAGGSGGGDPSSADAALEAQPADARAAGDVDDGPPILGGGPVPSTTVHQNIDVHDPSMIWDGKRYLLFATGSSAAFRSSTNLIQWSGAGHFLNGTPAWIPAALGQAPDPNTPWAPDISAFNGRFHVYYCASLFGKNTSVIGLVTNVSLDSTAPGYAWVDQGLVVQSKITDDYNAIDPSVAFDAAGAPWLAFGSFWSGIKLRKLDANTGQAAADDSTLYSLASRNGDAIEAPSIIFHAGYYYLFVSFDLCCQGVSSTYRTMVGRATAITGLYLDRSGQPMMQGGGDQLLASSGRYIGPGGGTAWKNGQGYLYAYHYYDGQANGASKLQVRSIDFTADNWVTLGDPVFP